MEEELYRIAKNLIGEPFLKIGENSIGNANFSIYEKEIRYNYFYIIINLNDNFYIEVNVPFYIDYNNLKQGFYSAITKLYNTYLESKNEQNN